jgi:hypothetical protein
MSLRFRRSIKLLPGIHANLGLHGIRLGVGPHGLHVGVNRRGIYTIAGIPGTGINAADLLVSIRGLPGMLAAAAF